MQAFPIKDPNYNLILPSRFLKVHSAIFQRIICLVNSYVSKHSQLAIVATAC